MFSSGGARACPQDLPAELTALTHRTFLSPSHRWQDLTRAPPLNSPGFAGRE